MFSQCSNKRPKWQAHWLPVHEEDLDILQINNLWILPGLVKLQLSNNMIENIDNLDALINLRELDLSFNNIARIENLDRLTNLEVFTIFENKIKKIENLDKLHQLKVISIGNNKISDMKNIVYLRRFKNLRSLNLAGNPICQNDHFQASVYAYLPNLVYYEYRMIADEERSQAQNFFLPELTVLQEAEAALEADEQKRLRELAEEQVNKTAFVEYLGGNHLFDAMFAHDPEGDALLLMGDEIHDIYKEYMKNFASVAHDIQQCGLEHLRLRKNEETEYLGSVGTAKQTSFGESRELLEKFLVQKKEMFDKVRLLLDTDDNDDSDAMAQLSEQIQVINENFQQLCLKTWHKLMAQELYLFEAIERVNKKLELSLTQQISDLIGAAQASFTQLRNLEAAYFEATTEIADRYQTRLALMVASNKETNMSPKLVEMMRSKKCLGHAISSSHDRHVDVINHREDQLVSSARSCLSDFLNNLNLTEVIRNRNHIAEINHFLDSQKEELHSILSSPILPNDI